MTSLGGNRTIEIGRWKALLASLSALTALCLFVLIGIDTAPAQTNTLLCVKLNKPRKGSVRIPANQLCRGNERGLLLNASGPQGPQGLQGIPGSPGAPGAPGGLSGHELETVPATLQMTDLSSGNVDVNCDTGKRVLGGGLEIVPADIGDANDIYVTASFPLDVDTWRVRAAVVPGASLAGTWTVNAWATCATASP
jgi:hypothetical protein